MKLGNAKNAERLNASDELGKSRDIKSKVKLERIEANNQGRLEGRKSPVRLEGKKRGVKKDSKERIKESGNTQSKESKIQERLEGRNQINQKD